MDKDDHVRKGDAETKWFAVDVMSYDDVFIIHLHFSSEASSCLTLIIAFRMLKLFGRKNQ